jgi:hypothetical protein
MHLLRNILWIPLAAPSLWQFFIIFLEVIFTVCSVWRPRKITKSDYGLLHYERPSVCLSVRIEGLSLDAFL